MRMRVMLVLLALAACAAATPLPSATLEPVGVSQLTDEHLSKGFQREWRFKTERSVDMEESGRRRRSTRVLVEAPTACAGAAGAPGAGGARRRCPADQYEFVLWGKDARKQLGN